MDKINLLKDLQKLRSDIDTIFNNILSIDSNSTNCTSSSQKEEKPKETTKETSVVDFIRLKGYSHGYRCRRTLKSLCKEYQKFCFENKITPFSIITFSKRLGELGFSKVRLTDGIHVNAKRN